MTPRVCQQCQGEFYYQKGCNHPGKYCSTSCRDAAASRKVTVVCAQCEMSFPVSPSHATSRKFCSPDCRRAYARVPKTCEQCDRPFVVKRYRVATARFCSRECASENRDQGVTPEHRRIRQSATYRVWRSAVFERDNHTCQECGAQGVVLEADHIKQFAFYPELRCVLSNGRTLCQPCHYRTSTHGRPTDEMRAAAAARLAVARGY